VTILQANKFFFLRGGSERYFFALSDALASRGHRVVHFSMQHPRNRPSPYSAHFVPQRDYDAARGALASPGAVLGFIRSRDAGRRMAGLAAATRPDVAHLHNIYHQLTPSIIDALADAGVPVVMTLHDYKLVCPSYAMFARGDYCYRCRGGRFHNAVAVSCGGSRARSALLALESFWQRRTRVYERVACFIAPSEYLRGVMVDAGIPADRIVYVAPLNPASPDQAAAKADDLARIDELPQRFIAYVGRLSAEKGIRVLLDAMRLTPEIPLVVFGEGPEEASLRAIASAHGLSNVAFAGHASHALIERALGRAVAVVLPTLSPENAPMAILEAANAGVPVVVSDRGGLPEMARRVGGAVVPAGEASALAAAIRDAWTDPARWKERARIAWHEHRDAHGAGAHTASIEAIYDRVRKRAQVAA
jgi:glycosyltransferase involved in cell wall biosynthesis